jgi:hypothetical protein
VVVLALWTGSYFRFIRYAKIEGRTLTEFGIVGGTIYLSWATQREAWRARTGWFTGKSSYAGHFSDLFPSIYPYSSGGMTGYNIQLPLWSLFVLSLIPTAIVWYDDRRRSPAGHCMTCGYDLTGNTTGVCPECGTKIKVRTPAK